MSLRQRDRPRMLHGVTAIALQALLALLYVGFVVLVVPNPVFFAFWAVWAFGLVLTIVLAARCSWASWFVPAAWLGAFAVAMLVGQRFLGWTP